MDQQIAELRANPRVQQIYQHLSPDAKAMFESLGNQNNEINQASGGWKNPLTKIPFMHPTSEYAPTETNIFGDIFDRPRAMVAAAASDLVRPITHDPYISPVQAFKQPREVPELGASQEKKYRDWAIQNLPFPVAVAGDMLRQPVSWASNIFGNPGNYIPLGALNRFGAGVVSKIPGATENAVRAVKWAREQLPTLGKVLPVEAAAQAVVDAKAPMRPAPKAGALPEDSAVAARSAQIQKEWEAFKAQQAAKQAVPQQAPLDESAAYQAWLEQHLPKIPESQRPPAEVPLHPAEDAIPLADAFNLKQNVVVGPDGQMVMKGGEGGQLGPQIFKPGKPVAQVPKPQPKGQMQFPFMQEPQQAPIDFPLFEVPPAGPAPKPPAKWAKAVPGKQEMIPGGEGGKLGPDVFPIKQNEVPIDRAAAEKRIAELRAKKQGAKPVAAQKPVEPQPPVQVMKLLKGDQPASLEQLAKNFSELPNPRSPAEVAERVAMRNELAARAKARGQQLKLNNKGAWELVNPQANPEAAAIKQLRKGEKIRGKAPVKPQPAAEAPMSALEAGILKKAQAKKISAGDIQDELSVRDLIGEPPMSVQQARFILRMEKERPPGWEPSAADVERALKVIADSKAYIAPGMKKSPSMQEIVAPKKAAKPVKQVAPVSEKEARKMSFRAEIERRRQELFKGMAAPKGKEVVKQELAGLAEGEGKAGLKKSAADKKIDALLARMPDEKVVTPDTSGKFVTGEKYAVPDQPNADLLEYQGFDPKEKQHIFKTVDGELVTHDEGSVIAKKLQPRKTTMGEAVKKSKKGLGNKGQAVAPIPEGEDIAKAAMEGAKKEVVGRLNIGKFPKEQQAQIKELTAGQEKKFTSPAISNAEIKARAGNIEHFPVSEKILKSPEGQMAAEITKLKSDEHARLKAIANDPKVSAIDKVRAVNTLALQKIQKVSTELGRGLQALRMETEVSADQMTALKTIIDQLRKDPTLTRKATQQAIRELMRPFPDLTQKVSVPAIYKFVFRNMITSGWRTITSNAISNTARAMVMPGTKTIDVTARKIVSMMNGTPTNATYKEVGAVVRGLWDALFGKKLEPEFFAATKTDKYGTSPFDMLADMAPTKGEERAWRIAGRVIAYPEWAMRGPDIYAKNMIGLAEKYAAKARGENLSDYNVREGIKDTQLKATFQDEMSRIGKLIARIRGSAQGMKPGPATDAIDMLLYSVQPFVQTVDRIIGGGLKLSPAGWFNPVLQAIEGSYKGAFAKGIEHDAAAAARLAEDMSYIIAGLPLTISTVLQYSKGNLVGAQPTDPDKREAFKTSGKIPYSFKLNGKYHPMRLLPEPAASGAQFTVAIMDALQEGAISGQEAAMQLWSGMLHFGGVVAGKPYLGGLNSLLSSFSSPISGKTAPKTPIELPVVRKIGSALVHSGIKDVAEIKDMMAGTPRKMSDNLFQDVRRRSGQTTGMVDELNTFGEPLTYGMSGTDLAARDPKYKLMEEVPPPTLDRNMMGYELTQQEYHDIKQALGAAYNRIYSLYSQNEDFMSMPQGMKADFMYDDIMEARDTVLGAKRMELEMRDPIYADEDLRRLTGQRYPNQKAQPTFPFLPNK
jgi:hypothetical protein